MIKHLVLILSIFVSNVSENGNRFLGISSHDELPSNAVSAICRDKDGRMWFATNGGVCRYEGDGIRTFTYSSKDTSSIHSNYTYNIFCDSKGDIWAGTIGGLSRYNPNTARFDRIYSPSLKYVKRILELDPIRYLISAEGKTYIYDMPANKFEELKINGLPIDFKCGLVDEGLLIFGSGDSCLEVFNYSDGHFSLLRQSIPIPSYPTEIIKSDTHRYWIATRNNGVMLLDLDEMKVLNINSKYLSSGIKSLSLSRGKRLWAVTNDGLVMYDSLSGEEKLLLSDRYLRCVFCDSLGCVWTGSSYGGVRFTSSEFSVFKSMILYSENDPLLDNTVKSVFCDEDGSLWIGTRSSGLLHYNVRTESYERFPEIEYPIAFLTDEHYKGELFAAAYGKGVFEIKKSDGSYRIHKVIPSINTILSAGRGRVWVCGSNDLFLLNPKTSTVSKVVPAGMPEHFTVRTALVRSNGHLVIGTNSEIKEYEVDSTFTLKEVYSSPEGRTIRASEIIEDRNGTLWVGSTDGLYKILDGKISLIISGNTLREENINGILLDDFGCLWMGTDNGICKYDDRSGVCSRYYETDGLTSNVFNKEACFRCPDGMLMFGSFNGITYFYPETVKGDVKSYSVNLSEIRIGNMEIMPGDGNGILEKEISKTDKIKLKHDQNNVSIKYYSTDFLSSNHKRFLYCMEGLNSDWVETGNNEVVFANLPHGKYRFRIKDANAGSDDELERKLAIIVKPAWYATVFARMIFILIVCLIVLRAILMAYENIKKKNAEKINGMKLSYEEQLRTAHLSSYIEPQSNISDEEKKFLSKLLVKIEAGIHDQKFSVESLANEMCLSRGNLHLKVKDITGHSTIDLIKRLKMEEACKMIRAGEKSMTEIAEETGFTSLSYFCASFKKEMGMTPRQYASMSNKKNGRNNI